MDLVCTFYIEPESMLQALFCIAGDIIGMKAVDGIRLLDCDWLPKLTESFSGHSSGAQSGQRYSTPAADRRRRLSRNPTWDCRN